MNQENYSKIEVSVWDVTLGDPIFTILAIFIFIALVSSAIAWFKYSDDNFAAGAGGVAGILVIVAIVVVSINVMNTKFEMRSDNINIKYKSDSFGELRQRGNTIYSEYVNQDNGLSTDISFVFNEETGEPLLTISNDEDNNLSEEDRKKIMEKVWKKL